MTADFQPSDPHGRLRPVEIYTPGMLADQRPEYPVAHEKRKRAAEEGLSPEAYAYVAGGAGAETTATSSLSMACVSNRTDSPTQNGRGRTSVGQWTRNRYVPEPTSTRRVSPAIATSVIPSGSDSLGPSAQSVSPAPSASSVPVS